MKASELRQRQRENRWTNPSVEAVQALASGFEEFCKRCKAAGRRAPSNPTIAAYLWDVPAGTSYATVSFISRRGKIGVTVRHATGSGQLSEHDVFDNVEDALEYLDDEAEGRIKSLDTWFDDDDE